MKQVIVDTSVMEARDVENNRYVMKAENLFRDGRRTCPSNEYAAYLVSEHTGLGVVPETEYVYVEELDSFCSLQKFIPGTVKNMAEMTEEEMEEINQDSLTAIFVLDCLTGNTDRKLHNILVDQDGIAWAIDNEFSLAFNEQIERVKRESAGHGIRDYEIDPFSYTGDLLVECKLVELLDPEKAYSWADMISKSPLKGFYEDLDKSDLSEDVKEFISYMVAFRTNILPYIAVAQHAHVGRKIGMDVVAVDIDGVIAETLDNGVYPDDYLKKKVIEGASVALWDLWANDTIIVYHTSRKEQDREITEKWLRDNGLAVHRMLYMDKPLANTYVDDKAIRFSGSWDVMCPLIKVVVKMDA